MNNIPVAGPWITEKEAAYAADAAATAWYANSGKYVTRFERAFADYLGVRYAVTLPSCTSGLHLALAALKIGTGDEVIVPECTWIATAAPISYVGATPVFADIDERTWCLCPDSLAAAITPATRAVIPVDLYGGMPDWDGIRGVARKHGIAVIEDAAEAIGSEFEGSKSGTLGDVGVFSFHGSKTMTTGEGGMLVTNDKAIYDRVMVLRDHGRPPGDRFFMNAEVAFKYKMSSVQAALGLAQLERIEELVGKKRQIYAWYAERLGGLPGLTLNQEPQGTKNSYWMSSVVLDQRFGVTTRDIMAHMDRHQIDTRPFFAPLSRIPAYQNQPQAATAQAHNPVSARVSRAAVNLPSALSLTREQVDYVSDTLRSFLKLRTA